MASSPFSPTIAKSDPHIEWRNSDVRVAMQAQTAQVLEQQRAASHVEDERSQAVLHTKEG